MHHTAFSRLHQMIMCLVQRIPQGLLPARVLALEQGGWAVPMEIVGFDDESEFVKLCQGERWDAWVQSDAKGEQVSLADAVCRHEDFLRYVDPFMGSPDRVLRNTGAPTTICMAARDDVGADRLLEELTRCRIAGISAQFFASQDPESYRFLCSAEWLCDVDRSQPPLSALTLADRAWWGPLAGVTFPQSIFLQWPYESTVPMEILLRLDWEAPWALIGKDPPHILRIQPPPSGGPILRPLVNLSELTVARSKRVRVCASAEDSPPRVFHVELAFTRTSRENKLLKSINALELQLAVKKAELEAMGRLRTTLGRRHLSVGGHREPLFIYPVDEEEAMPEPLRRLLVEWLPEDSQRVFTCRAAEMPLSVGTGNTQECHIVTTAFALGKADRSDVGLRLREYAPERGLWGCYELMEEWETYGLRIFVPAEKHLVLYPELHPNERVADKMARAFLPQGQGASEEWCLLLKPEGVGGKICVIQLPVGGSEGDGFLPLCDAFSFQCPVAAERLKMSPWRPERVRESILAFTERAESQLLDEIDRDLGPWRGGMEDRLKGRIDVLMTQLRSEKDLMEARQKGLESLRLRLDELDQNVAQLREKALRILPEVRDMDRRITRSRDREALYGKLGEIVKNLNMLQDHRLRLMERIEEVSHA